MSSTTAQPDKEPGLGFSVYRSVLTQYWPMTVYVLAYTAVGMALGAYIGSFDITLAVLLLAALWLGLEGLHAIDLADEGVATRVDSTIGESLGWAQVALGGLVGVWIAYLTTWLFLIFVAFELFLGLAYNKEWFGGVLHDWDTKTGLANFSLAWGGIPALTGFFVMSGTVTVGMVLVAIGIMFDAARLLSLFEASKPVPYQDRHIEHTREYNRTPEWLTEQMHSRNMLNLIAWVFVAAGLTVMFVL